MISSAFGDKSFTRDHVRCCHYVGVSEESRTDREVVGIEDWKVISGPSFRAAVTTATGNRLCITKSCAHSSRVVMTFKENFHRTVNVT